MKYTFAQSLKELGIDKSKPINTLNLDPRLCYDWASTNDFVKLFLPFLKIKIDSREQDKWFENACAYFGITTELAKKDKKKHTENLKEGDITFCVCYGNKTYDYTNIVAYERKGSANEFLNNVIWHRERLEREFERKVAKSYKKFVLVLETGFNLLDMVNYKFYFYNKDGTLEEKSCKDAVFSTLLSWIQPNKYAFDIIQYDTQKRSKTQKMYARNTLFWLILCDMFYFFRQEIRKEAEQI